MRKWIKLFSLQTHLDSSTGIGTSGPMTSERLGTLIGVLSLGIGGRWYLERSTENGPVTTGVGLGGGASASSVVGDGAALEPLASAAVVAGGGACLGGGGKRESYSY